MTEARILRPPYLVGLAVALLTGRVIHLAGRDLFLDDAFISFRYARNFAAGHGLVFNPGERVEGYTNFLWTLLLGAAHRLGFDIPTFSVVLAYLATVGTLVVLYLLGRKLFARHAHGAWLATVAPLIFAAMGVQARYVVSGMETSLFVFLLAVATLFFVAAAPPFIIGLAFALATLTRPDGGLYLAVLLLYQLTLAPAEGIRQRLRTAAGIGGGFAVLFAPYFLWRLDYYGYLLPNTFYLKAGGLSRELAARGWELLLQCVCEARLELPLALAVLAVAAVRRERIWALCFATLGATLLYFVVVGGDFLLFFGPRFLLPALPALLLLAAEGVALISGWGARLTAAGRPALAATAVSVLLVNGLWFSWPARFDTIEDWAAINRGWIELGKWLRENTPDDAVIAVGAAGFIPYFSERTTIDMLGMNDLHIAHLDLPLGQGIPGHEKFDTGYILRRSPDYIVFARLDPMGRPILVGWPEYRERVEAAYEMIALSRSGRQAGPRPWVVAAAEFTPELGEQGYLGAVYRRRSAELGATTTAAENRAADPAAAQQRGEES